MSDRNTTNIMDFINKDPIWINNDDWNKMIKDIWSTSEFQRRSKFARNNQLTETNGKLSTHSRGIVLFTSYRAGMIIFFYLLQWTLKFYIYIFYNFFG
jgi:hypothetical protein